MRKGTVPVPYIIALILGIIVVGLLAFWFFVLGGQLPFTNTQQNCNAKRVTFCTTWAASGYTTTSMPKTWDKTCTDAGISSPTAQECRVLFGLKPKGAACSLGNECQSGSCSNGLCD